MEVLQEGAWSNLRRVGWGRTIGYRGKRAEILEGPDCRQTQNSGNMEMG